VANITKQELLHLAQLSRISLHENELEPLVKDIDAVLTYAARVKEIAADVQEVAIYKNVNVFREDQVKPTDPEPLLAQAPAREHNFFVVPVIIESQE